MSVLDNQRTGVALDPHLREMFGSAGVRTRSAGCSETHGCVFCWGWDAISCRKALHSLTTAPLLAFSPLSTLALTTSPLTGMARRTAPMRR
jgi:hypothetical protein